jgi:hypothetical protein
MNLSCSFCHLAGEIITMTNILIGVVIGIFLTAYTICTDKSAKDVLMCLGVGSIVLIFALGLITGW